MGRAEGLDLYHEEYRFLKDGGLKVLSGDYTPTQLPHRDGLEKEFARIGREILMGGDTGCIAIHGPPGTGKTAVSKRFLEQLRKAAAIKNRKDTRTIYVDCEHATTTSRVVLSIHEDLLKTETGPRHLTTMGLSEAEYFRNLVAELSGKDIRVALVLDELDKHRNVDDLLRQIKELHAHCPQLHIKIIVITNDPTFDLGLKKHVQSRLGTPRVFHVPPYQSAELEDILRLRAKEAARSIEAFDEDVIPYIASFVAGEDGDARKALDLLRQTVLKAEDEGAKRITHDHARKAVVDQDTHGLDSQINGLPSQQRIVLACALRAAGASRQTRFRKNGAMSFTATEVHAIYQKEVHTGNQLGYRQVWNLLVALGDQMLLSYSKTGAGRGKGMKLVFTLRHDVKDLVVPLSTDPQTATLVVERAAMVRPLPQQ